MEILVNKKELMNTFPTKVIYTPDGEEFCYYVTIKEDNYTFYADTIKIAVSGYREYDMKAIQRILNIDPIPESSDTETQKLLYRTYYYKHKKQFDKTKKDYVILRTQLLTCQILNPVKYEILY